MPPRPVHLWSSPRNLSTALLYSFAQHPAVAVVDEPLYAHYLRRQPTEAHHPGRDEVLAAQSHDGNAVLRRLHASSRDRPFLVCKQMTHHLIGIDRELLAGADHFLLIRDPREILQSFAKVVDRPTLEDLGLPQQRELYDWLTQRGWLTGIIDARRLLLDPEGVLRGACRRIGLAFAPTMLSWPAGPRPEDGVWAKYWYANVHASTGFAAYRPRTITLRPGEVGIDETAFAAALDWYGDRLAEAL